MKSRIPIEFVSHFIFSLIWNLKFGNKIFLKWIGFQFSESWGQEFHDLPFKQDNCFEIENSTSQDMDHPQCLDLFRRLELNSNYNYLVTVSQFLFICKCVMWLIHQSNIRLGLEKTFTFLLHFMNARKWVWEQTIPDSGGHFFSAGKTTAIQPGWKNFEKFFIITPKDHHLNNYNFFFLQEAERMYDDKKNFKQILVNLNEIFCD